MYEIVLLLSTTIYVLLLYVYLKWDKSSSFHPLSFYIFFHGLVFVVRPIFQYIYSYNLIYYLYRFWPDDSIRIQSVIVANLGFVTFFFTALALTKRRATFIHPPPHGVKYRAKFEALVAAVICLPLALLSAWYQLSGRIGIGDSVIQMDRDPTTMAAINTNVSGYVSDANTMLGPIALIIAWAYRFRPTALIPFLLFVAYRMYLGNGRWAFVLTFAMLCLLYLYDKRERWLKYSFIAPAVIILFVFNTLQENRNFFQEIYTGQKINQSYGEKRDFFDGMDFANLEYLQFVLYVVPGQSKTYDYFVNNLQILTEPIPRTLWPGKPAGPPILMFNYFDYGFPIGFTVSLPGQGWAQLGWFGVIIWCAFGSWIWTSLYNWFMGSQQTRIQVVTYCFLAPISIQWFRDGYLLSLIKFPLFILAPVFVWKCVSFVKFSLIMTNGNRRLRR